MYKRQVLGADDLGIYNVVGGIIALMSFFQAAQTKATSRFITYELGKNSVVEKLKHVFSDWIDNGHNDFSDTNTIILCIEISDGVLFSHGQRYEI